MKSNTFYFSGSRLEVSLDVFALQMIGRLSFDKPIDWVLLSKGKGIMLITLFSMLLIINIYYIFPLGIELLRSVEKSQIHHI